MTVRRLESVPRPRYFRFCNVLHIWTIRAIPTYRVYGLYDNESIWGVRLVMRDDFYIRTRTIKKSRVCLMELLIFSFNVKIGMTVCFCQQKTYSCD